LKRWDRFEHGTTAMSSISDPDGSKPYLPYLPHDLDPSSPKAR
jgi:hypothetical protein